MDKISVIIPCHNNAGALRRVYTDVLREVKKLPVSYELLFIDNASRDGSSAILRLLSQQDYACHYVSLNHRVTPVSAIFLGAQLSNGDFLMLTDTWQDRLYSLMITYGNCVLTYIGMGVFILLTGVPCFLLFMMFLDLLYAVLLYTGLFISLLFLFTRFRHHPYFFRHEQLLLTDIRESTLPNPPIQKPDISKL